MCDLSQACFTVADGPEVETDYYFFDALNTPPTTRRPPRGHLFIAPRPPRFGNVTKKIPGEIPSSHPRFVGPDFAPCSRASAHPASSRRAAFNRRDPPMPLHIANFHQRDAIYVDKNVPCAT